MAVYALVENCEYGTLKDKMIRDRLVVGICDSALLEKLRMDTAKKMIHQREAVH